MSNVKLFFGKILPTILLFCGLLSSCSQQSTSTLAVGFHNVTARYNAYVIARDKMKEAENTLANNRKDDYNQLMPILLPLDSVKAMTVKALLDDVIKKASLIPDRHQNSKWVDNALVLIGKARLYKGQFADGIETLKYVNSKGKDENDKHLGLIWLMRAYIETKDFNNALAVSEYLRSEPLNKQNTVDFYLNKAYLHQQKQEYTLSVAILEETFGLLKKNEETARVHFAAAQMYDLLEKPAMANVHYKAVLRNRPSYDLGFFASMDEIQNEALTDPNISTENGFKKLLNDRKNSDLKDRLYYSMGMIENRKQQYQPALGFFKKSIQNTTINTSQVPYTYLEMAKINYDKLQNYEQAKAYYDSSLALLPRDSPQFQKITDRKIVLDDFVKNLTTVRTEDSLQRLSQMNPNTLEKFLDGLIEKQITEEAKQAEDARKLIDAAKSLAINADLDGDPKERFVLYDVVSANQGKIDFQQKWGRRNLEDDWRRSKKTSASTEQVSTRGSNSTNEIASNSTENQKITKNSPEWKTRRDALYKNIPLRREDFEASNKRVEDALYQLGKIYKFGLEEPQNSTKTFESLVNRFPTTSYKQETYYLLYLLADKTPKQADWKNKLAAEFPNSPYLKILNRTGGAVVAVAANPEQQAQKDYEEVLALYDSGNYTEAYARLESDILNHAGTKAEDKFGFLKIYLSARLQGRDGYMKAINEFIKKYPKSQNFSRAKELLDAQLSNTSRKE